ncbi:MAG: VacJ family lipoprotein [Terrimicrobiaceae bacterium]
MKIRTFSALLLAGIVTASLLSSCASKKEAAPVAPATVGDKTPDGKSMKSQVDDLEEYQVLLIPDPLEPLNRATFTLNHGIYIYVFSPISKGYQTVVPKPVRTGIHNAYENVKFPIRFVNDTLQGNFERAGLETGKFVVNSIVGIGGLGRPSDRIPALADIPAGNTGQTFAKWGIPHGAYLVLPVLGPSSLRDTVGLAGDYALNPVSWVTILFGGYAWTMAIPSVNTLRSLPVQMDIYDAATKDAIDPYVAARSAYVQFREEDAAK